MVYACSVLVDSKVAVQYVHPAVIALFVLHFHRCTLYHASCAIGSAVYHGIALVYASVNVITHALYHAVINLLGVDVVDDGLVRGLVIAKVLQSPHRVFINDGKLFGGQRLFGFLPLQLIHASCVLHLHVALRVVAVHVAVVGTLCIFVLLASARFHKLGKVYSAQVQ